MYIKIDEQSDKYGSTVISSLCSSKIPKDIHMYEYKYKNININQYIYVYIIHIRGYIHTHAKIDKQSDRYGSIVISSLCSSKIPKYIHMYEYKYKNINISMYTYSYTWIYTYTCKD
jgi:hypothetical protein